MPKLRACDACFHRKIQCTISEQGMPCNWCRHQNLTCEFTRKQRTKPPKRSDKKEQLLQKIRELEHILAEKSSSVSPSADNFVAFATHNIRLNWYHRGTRIFSDDGLTWISSQTNQSIATLRALLSDCPAQEEIQRSKGCQDASLRHNVLVLPPRESAERVFADFPKSIYQHVFPSLHAETVASIIETAYGTSDTTRSPAERQAAASCLFAAFATMAHLQAFTYITTVAFDAQSCAEMAQSLLGDYHYSTNLDELHAVLLLQRYRTITGQHHAAEKLHHNACRIICELQTNAKSSLGSRQQQQHHRVQSLFWLSYISDKDLSLASGKPPLLVSDYCDMSTPEPLAVAEEVLHEPDDMLRQLAVNRLIQFYAGDARLSRLKERVFRMLYAPASLSLPDHDLLARIRLLDDELESWRTSIPSALRPNLSSSHDSCDRFSSSLRSVQLQLDYHYTLSSIHTTVRRLGAATHRDHLPEDLHSVMHSSIDLSLEASRSTLQILSEPLPISPQSIFWHTAFYPLMASVSLFVNILLHPLELQADTDAASLELGVRIVTNMCTADDANRGDMRRNRQTRDFIQELLRLAQSAISKAKNKVMA